MFYFRVLILVALTLGFAISSLYPASALRAEEPVKPLSKRLRCNACRVIMLELSRGVGVHVNKYMKEEMMVGHRKETSSAHKQKKIKYVGSEAMALDVVESTCKTLHLYQQSAMDWNVLVRRGSPYQVEEIADEGWTKKQLQLSRSLVAYCQTLTEEFETALKDRILICKDIDACKDNFNPNKLGTWFCHKENNICSSEAFLKSPIVGDFSSFDGQDEFIEETMNMEKQFEHMKGSVGKFEKRNSEFLNDMEKELEWREKAKERHKTSDIKDDLISSADYKDADAKPEMEIITPQMIVDKATKQFKNLDSNADGTVTVDEIRAAVTKEWEEFKIERAEKEKKQAEGNNNAEIEKTKNTLTDEDAEKIVVDTIKSMLTGDKDGDKRLTFEEMHHFFMESAAVAQKKLDEANEAWRKRNPSKVQTSIASNREMNAAVEAQSSSDGIIERDL